MDRIRCTSRQTRGAGEVEDPRILWGARFTLLEGASALLSCERLPRPSRKKSRIRNLEPLYPPLRRGIQRERSHRPEAHKPRDAGGRGENRIRGS